MKRSNFQEPKSEPCHSCFSDMDAVTEQAPTTNIGRSKSVAVLGLALSFGASGVLFADSEATASVGSLSITTSENSSEPSQLPSVLRNRLDQASLNGETVYHTVERGDSLWQIAREHQVELQDIKTANRISPESPLQVGQVIKVPNEEANDSTVVSLLPDLQKSAAAEQENIPDLERLIAGIPNANSESTNIEQAESAAVDEPAVVATEELTGDVSLRSAGLVSQSDGFQADLKQLESATQVASLQAETEDSLQIELQTSPELQEFEAVNDIETVDDIDEAANAETVDDIDEVANAEVVDSIEASSYEVRPGDTVDDIAVSLGTTSEELAEANGLKDPDFILAGETLSVPIEVAENVEVAENLVIAEAADTIAQASPEMTASTSSVGGFDGTRLSRLQSTVATRIDGSLTLNRLKGSEDISAAFQSETAIESGTSDEVATVADPYTADLLADVNSAQGLETSLEPEADVALRPSTALPNGGVVNPEFQTDRLEIEAISDDRAEQNSELLAAAPLDPSAYVSSPTPAAGQVVSPEMPIMPSADEYLPEAPDYFNGYIWPTRGTLTSGYGWRWGRMHRGIDVAGPVGTPIVSAAAGVVERAGWNSGGYGNLVEVRHADGSMTRYAHNSRITVSPGQRVSQGQHIADMGSTGYSTGPHLHFEVHLPDRGTVNPMAMLPGN